ncbi:cleavage/polyadenylation factor CFT1 [Aspergillus puulaauensis]|uniref:Protein CFT1 n=1 Tax=Aspergillus puulaauensis TaxID=1220207 RepID=A0A7R7XH72_9EURO|nr:mRNA cleavage and polyadenylation factor subunit [Aspergillus puulaauensis]BCS21380.1 mRNA cleavage and polyadenylation factor subunit [Aspergillus puulaauensis]
MQCYTELLPPTGITHALAVPFLSATARNLVVVRTSLLQIFSLRTVPSSPDDPGEWPAQKGQDTQKLVLEREYQLPGTITDFCRVRILKTKSGGDAILLASRDSKLSLIEWDPERHGISTVSIHYYERDDMTISPWVSDLGSCGSMLSADPSSRCAVFQFGARNLAIIPFHQPGDDLVMDDYGSEFGADNKLDGNSKAHDEAKSESDIAYQTPYASSFVLPLTALDPSVIHPISLAFLYEYREPTFGILYSQIATSDALLHERKDVVFYTVFTLDLEQRASTTLLSVTRLPSDLFKVVALPPPVGGSLLIGSNELVHVDQAGKTNAVGVNEFSRQVSSFSMTDQSDLAIRLENCAVERFTEGNGDLLLALFTGEMALISFKLDGRSVSGLSVRLMPAHADMFLASTASCSAFLGNGKVFFGSEDSDSVLLSWSSMSSVTKKSKSQARHSISGDFPDDDDQSEDDAYEDDLYSSAPDRTADNSQEVPINSSAVELGDLRIHDKLFSPGPINDVVLGKSSEVSPNSDGVAETALSELELVAAQGSDGGGALVIMKREIDPCIVASMATDSADSLWTVSLTQAPSDGGNQKQHDYVILSKQESNDREESEVFILENKLRPFTAPEFNPNHDLTIEIGTLQAKNRVIQVLRNEVRSYDANLGLAQIYPVWDEDNSDERAAICASLADPYLAIICDDLTLLLLQADDSGDLDEMTVAQDAASQKWLSACLYTDKTGFFSNSKSHRGNPDPQNIFLFLLNQDHQLHIYRLPDLKLMSTIEGVGSLSPILSTEPPKRSTTRENLIQLVVADLGDSKCCLPYLILRTGSDDLVVYKPFLTDFPSEELAGLRFLKEANHVLPKIPTTSDDWQSGPRPLRVLPNISGCSSVFIPGSSAGFVFRTSATSPHFIRLRGDYTKGLGCFSSPDKGFAYLDSDGLAHLATLPHGTQSGYSWAFKRVLIGEQIDQLTYSSTSNTYVLGTCHRSGFKLPDDDELHPEWRNEVISFLPEVHQSSLKVVSPKTWTVIDSYPLEPAEHIMALKTMSLEVSENTHERRDMIVVGTSLARGEDIPSRGCIYVFEVIKVVSDPDQPQANHRLKLVGKEPVKGAVTALSEIGSQGFLIAAQGQKSMVRGLKEDGSLLPVAFMDMQCYVSVVKELRGTGMCILGDAVKGLWFAGYSEPYKMSLFAKDLDYLEVLAADFLPDNNKLFIVVADSDCNLYVLQYDPEDPNSSNGDKLLNRSKFHTGNFASGVTLLPRTLVSSERVMSGSDDMDMDSVAPLHNVLVTSHNGSIGLVTGVSEESYRRLSALQSQLTNSLEHPCGLNPRAYRAVESDASAGRGMLDGNLLFQYLDMSKQRKVEIAGRVGAKEWEIKADLEVIGGDGLGYL